MVNRLILALIAILFTPFIVFGQGASFETERGNIYAAGGSIAVAEDSRNDIVAAGGNVSISGNAANEVLAAGGSLVLSGKTGGDARLAGGNLTVAGIVGGEAVLAGERVHVLPKAGINGGLIAAGGEVNIEGTVEGFARVFAGTVMINGTITKDLYIKADRVVIGKNAKINGNLRYEAPREAVVEPGAVIKGQKSFTRTEYKEPRKRFLAFISALWLVKLLAVLAAALVIHRMLPHTTTDVTNLGVNQFGRELLVGFLVFVGVPAVILALFITVIGWFLGLVLAFLFIGLVMISSVFGALTFTRLVSAFLFKKTSLTWPLILAGVVVYQILGLVPFLGTLFKLAFILTALGALSHSIYLARQQRESGQ